MIRLPTKLLQLFPIETEEINCRFGAVVTASARYGWLYLDLGEHLICVPLEKRLRVFVIRIDEVRILRAKIRLERREREASVVIQGSGARVLERLLISIVSAEPVIAGSPNAAAATGYLSPLCVWLQI